MSAIAIISDSSHRMTRGSEMVDCPVDSPKRGFLTSTALVVGFVLCMASLSGCADENAEPRLSDIEEIKKLGCRATSSDDVLKAVVAAKEFDDSSLEKLPTFVTKFKSITSLDLKDSSVTPAGLVHLAKLPSIESLDLSNMNLGNDGLMNLASLKDVLVSDLILDGNGIDNAGLKDLEGLGSLKFISLMDNGGVTDVGIEALTNAIPNLEVER